VFLKTTVSRAGNEDGAPANALKIRAGDAII